MTLQSWLSPARACAILLIVSVVLSMSGAMLWSGSNQLHWPVAQNPAYLLWERGVLMAALVLSLLGLALLEEILRGGGDLVVARLAFVTYLVSAALGLVVESYFISDQQPLYALLVTYSLLAFLGQAAFGLAILITGVLPAWVGWTTIVWNLGLPLLLVVVSAHDIYYPVSITRWRII